MGPRYQLNLCKCWRLRSPTWAVSHVYMTPPNENLGTESQGDFPGWQPSPTTSHIVLGERSTVHATPRREETWKTRASSLLDANLCAFSIC